MYKTIWLINDDNGNKTELTWYHFGKKPKFPTWYMEKGTVYEIEMTWSVKLVHTLNSFFKCLFHEYIVR